MSLPSPVIPEDTLIGPLQEELCLVAQQIQGVDPGLCYAKPPKGQLQEGAVLFPCKGWQVESATNGRLRLRITFHALHLFRLRALDEVIPDIQTYIPAWWTVLGAWHNQTLGGRAISFDFTGGDIQLIKHNGTDFYALQHTLSVLVQFRVPTA